MFDFNDIPDAPATPDTQINVADVDNVRGEAGDAAVEAAATETDDAPVVERAEGEQPETEAEEGKTKEAAPETEAEVEDAPAEEKPAELTPIQRAAIEAAKALGVTETDPEKLADAITAHLAKVEETKAAEVAARRAEEDKTVAERITKEIVGKIDRELKPMVKAELILQGHDLSAVDANGNYVTDNAGNLVNVLDVPNWFNLPQNAEILAAYNEARAKIAADPVWEARYQSDLNRSIQEHTTRRSAEESLPTRFPNMVKSIDDILTKNDVPIAMREDFAKLADADFQAKLATYHSAIEAKDAEITALKTTISGHAAALEAAKTEALTAARNEIIRSVKAGEELKTPGQLGTPMTEVKTGYQKGNRLKFDEIPTAV